MYTPPPTTHPAIVKLFDIFFTPQKVEASAASQTFLDTAAQTEIPFNDLQLILSAWGDGPTVLLVHGWGGNRAQLRGFVPPLVEAGFRVVAFDFPAHGDAPGLTTNILEMSAVLKRVADYAGPFHAIIAHSFGTLVTSYTLIQHPEISPSRLVYFGAMNRLMDSFPRFQQLADLSDEITTRLQRTVEETFGRDLLASINNESLTPRLHIPALMFHDENDPVTPVEDSLEIARVWPMAKLTVTKGLGHRNALRHEGIIRETVTFIAQPVAEGTPVPV